MGDMTEGFKMWLTLFYVKWVPNKQKPASDCTEKFCDCFQASYKPKKWICAKQQYGKSKRPRRFKFCGHLEDNQSQLTSENQLYCMKDVAVRMISVKARLAKKPPPGPGPAKILDFVGGLAGDFIEDFNTNLSVSLYNKTRIWFKLKRKVKNES